MRNNLIQRNNQIELLISLVVLFILAWFTYGIFLKAPYAGFYYNPSDGRIIQIVKNNGNSSLSLQLGDVLKKIGPITWEQFKANKWLVFFENTQAGETVDIAIERNGLPLTVQWIYPGFNSDEFESRFFNIWFLAFPFWLAGFVSQLSIRPKDLSWKLFISANYLTSLWLVFGCLSAWHLWGSSIFLHAVSWLILPVYLHLHWIFPHSLKDMPKVFWFFIYGLAGAFAIAELFQLLPNSFYALAFFLALAGSVILQIIHFRQQPAQRRQIGLLAISTFLAVLPTIAISIIEVLGEMPQISPGALLALPFMPLAYFIVIYRQRLGGLELKINRALSIYAFLIILGIFLLFLLIPITRLHLDTQTGISLAIVIIIVTAIITITGFPRFQAFVEQHFLGIRLPYHNLQESYSSRIAASTSASSLLQLLDEDIFPSLLVRQYAFMQLSNGNFKNLLLKNVSIDELPREKDIDALVSQAGRYIHVALSKYEWIRLILPLNAGDSLIGFWLLGHRDPDDIYAQSEIPIMQSIANQTAIALSNIQHAEQLRSMYQSDIDRYEKERKRLALELHDSVLNGLAVLRNNLDESNLSLRFQASYEEVIHRLREIVSDLRPPMLMYGLKPAIDELADNLMERSGDKIKIHVDIQTSEGRIPENIEQHLYRIVQEACENSIRHANAERIGIFGTLTPQKTDLIIEDDGKGFNGEIEINSLIVNNHFGLAGMVERAHLIDAEIHFESIPNAGLKIYIRWTGNSNDT